MSGIGWSSLTQVKTNNQNIDGLLSGYKWGQTSITFSFPTSNGEYASSYQNGTPTNNFGVVTDQMKVAARFALDAGSGLGGASFSVEAFTNLNIAETSATKATLRFAQSNQPATAFAYYPGTNYDEAGDVWFGRSYSYTNPVAGTYAWHTMLHEIGHALGLKHGQETGTYGAVPANRDAMEYTIMTYRSYIGDPLSGGYSNEANSYAQTYMMLDIAALQTMYGADFTTNSGNTVYKWDPNSGNTLINGQVAITAAGNRIFATIWDGSGIDTYDLSSYTTGVKIDLRPGESSYFSTTQIANLGDGKFASGNIYNALLFNGDLRSLIENAVGGSGNDTINGNQAANTIWGGGGADTIFGFDGADTLYGDAGIDVIVGGDHNDFIRGGDGGDFLEGDGGADTILGDDGDDTIFGDGQAGGIAGNDWIEGGNGNDIVMGQDGNDTIYGQAGNDTIVGGAGNDLINGGLGNDFLEGDGGNDSILGEGGDDTIYGDGQGGGLAGNDWIEAGAGNDIIFGQEGNDVIFGQDGNDSLTGGEGYDILYGGTGFDNFYFVKPTDGYDYIGDFALGDALVFQSSSFGGITSSNIASHFYSGAGFSGFAVSGPYFAYDTNSGNLWYNDMGTARLISQMTVSSLSYTSLYFF